MTKLKVGADTWIDEAQRGAQHGQDGRLSLNAGGSDEKYALLHVSIPGFAGAIVQSATLHVFLKGTGWSSGEKICADLLESRFREGDTWHTYGADIPSLPGPNQGEETLGGAAGDEHHVEVDVTDLMADAAAASAFYGLLLSTDQATTRALYSTEASAGVRPYLTMVYAQAPEAPTGLAPVAWESGRYPRLKWDSSDQTEYRVETSPTGVTPDGDSGWIASEEHQADLSDTGAWDTAPTIANVDGTVTYWRVQVRNVAGAASAWTEWVSFTRADYLGLTIDFPVSDLDEVDATTPDIEWTLGTGVEQTAYQVLLEFDDPADGELGYDSGRVSGAAGLHTIPAGTLAQADIVYRATVRAWDDTPRDAPGEAGRVDAVRTFSYAPGVTTTAVTTLSASADGPAIVLDWTRASAPDAFVILADGVVIDDAVDPADVALGGTAYRRRVLTLQTFDDEVEFEVAARDDATGDSSSNPTATATYSPHGIWICWPERALEVQLRGHDDIPMELLDDGATFFPAGQRAPVRIGGTVRGYASTASGFVEGAEDRDKVKAVKDREPGSSELRLVFGTFNLPIEVGKLVLTEWPAVVASRKWSVSLEFWQVGPPWPA